MTECLCACVAVRADYDVCVTTRRDHKCLCVCITVQRPQPVVAKAEANYLIPEWSIAVIVIGLTALLFMLIFGIVLVSIYLRVGQIIATTDGGPRTRPESVLFRSEVTIPVAGDCGSLPSIYLVVNIVDSRGTYRKI